MCEKPKSCEPKRNYAADDLATILGAFLTPAPPTAEQVRRMIRTKWETIKLLAHAVHEEEISGFRRDQRRARAELDDYSKYA